MKHKITGIVVRVPDYHKSLMESRGYEKIEFPINNHMGRDDKHKDDFLNSDQLR